MQDFSLVSHGSFVQLVIRTCGPGRILDIGCGDGAVVKLLVAKGVDAYGIDLSGGSVADGNRFMPGRFQTAPVEALPYPDASFDTLICSHYPAHLSADEVYRAMKEMRRVCRRNLFLRMAKEVSADGIPPRAAQPRAWWESIAFRAGFRKHPLYYQINPYHTLEAEDGVIGILLEKIPDDALALFPLDALMRQRDLHMDMSRETGRRSDAHMARYHLAAGYVRDGDTVLDAACGLGYGSRMLAFGCSASRVIGSDLDPDSVAYARANFCQDEPRLFFETADAQNLGFLPDNSIDLFVSFETLEHVPNPKQLIAEAKRILRPGGRFIASVPNLWVNEEGVDPNPYHLHVYDWARLTEEIASAFLFESAYAQTAGGGMKLPNHPRSFLEFSPQSEAPPDAEWYVAVAMKDPIDFRDVPYRETALRWSGDPPNVAAFARDYENPWLLRSMISIGWRNRNALQRAELARRVLATTPLQSPDAGAALCVLAYHTLDSSRDLDPAAVRRLADQIRAYVALKDSRPQCQRWVISLLYVEGLLWKAIGDLDKAIQSFTECATSDPLVYSPLLATKTVNACRLGGQLLFQAGRLDEARDMWKRGIIGAQAAVCGNWREILGDLDSPFTFGLREMAEVLDSAGGCADGLHHLNVSPRTVGLSNDGSYVFQIEYGKRHLQFLLDQMTVMESSPQARLQRALQRDPRGFRRLIRITYLLALMLTPQRIKALFRPLLSFIRRLSK
uniref:methyltransferase domain-containing protein n=1 Tax=Hylemonella sp. TaxID=2066020 RepID=UPI0035B403BE